jgi:4-amino-4-deoxy-L-arabinose transferase-like glycosyltransferase
MVSIHSWRADPSTRLLITVVLGVALILRVGAIVVAGDMSATANLWENGEMGACGWQHDGDLCRYYGDASGQVYPSAYMPPLLSYLWLGLFGLFGDTTVARVAWLGFNVAAAIGCVALLFYLSMKLWPSRWAAFAAAGLLAVYPTFVIVTATYHQTNWAVLLLLAISAVAVKLAEGASPARFGALGGLLCGLAALNRSEMLIIGPAVIALGAAWRRRPPVLATAVLAGVLIMALTLAPWTARNYQHFERVIPTAQSAGYNLWKGYNLYTNGSGNLSDASPAAESIRLSVAPGPMYEPRVQDAYEAAFKSDMHTSSMGRLVRLEATKVALLWGFDWTDREVTGRIAYRLPLLLTSLLALIGFGVACHRRHLVRTAPAVIIAAVLALLTAAYVVTAVHARYRMHIEPFLFILAGIGIEAIWMRLLGPRIASDSGLQAKSLHENRDQPGWRVADPLLPRPKNRDGV